MLSWNERPLKYKLKYLLFRCFESRRIKGLIWLYLPLIVALGLAYRVEYQLLERIK